MPWYVFWLALSVATFASKYTVPSRASVAARISPPTWYTIRQRLPSDASDGDSLTRLVPLSPISMPDGSSTVPAGVTLVARVLVRSTHATTKFSPFQTAAGAAVSPVLDATRKAGPRSTDVPPISAP